MARSFWKQYSRLLITLGSAAFIVVGTILAIQFGKGYRPTSDGILAGTGLLAASSNPTGARITIDGELSDSITNDTLSLRPGNYNIEISQEGFTTWQKTITIEPELVTTTDAHLFRTVPSISPLTFSGAVNLTPSPDGQKIAFSVASPSAQLKAGLYLIELSDRPSLFSKGTRLLAENPRGRDFAQAQILWSPDSTQLIASFDTANFVLDTNTTLAANQLTDATSSLPLLLSSWEDEITRREKQLLLTLPDEMIDIATSSAKNLFFSPNGEKLLYTATKPATIPDDLIPALPASSTQPETRTLTPGGVYVYDLEEDKNFLLTLTPANTDYTKQQLITDISESSLFISTPATQSATPILQDPASLATTITNFRSQYSSFPYLNYQWFPTSKHILINDSGSVIITEYDNTNRTTLYSGSFEQDFVYPWPDGSKLLILTNLTNNPGLPANLYAINLK